jgi:hypothetical protein
VLPLAEQKEKKQESPRGPDGEVCRDLMCAEEWKDPEGRQVLTEYHKEGLPKELAGVDADLEIFEQYWKKKGGTVKVKGEYHKDGAPFLDRNQNWDTIKKSDEPSEETTKSEPTADQKEGETPREQPKLKEVPPSATLKSQSQEGASPQRGIQRPIDLGLIEMVSYALFRVAFSKGLNIPIKREGMVDMNVTVRGKEVTINTNQLFFSVPELNVWHIVYQHKGKPILEIGRGVKNGVKIHRLQAIRLGLEMWNGSRKINKQRLKQLKEADRKVHAGVADE